MCDTALIPLFYNNFPEIIVYWTKISCLIVVNFTPTYQVPKQAGCTHIKSKRKDNKVAIFNNNLFSRFFIYSNEGC